MPLERLEAQICELAGHLTAATCRFLVLLADFDARRGWASWDMNSCAAWLSWKCQMSSGTAREHVRVARALRDLPVIRAEFAAARLSYAKVRALTRIATPDTEVGLAEIAGPMTGNQLERFARAHRQASQADDAAARVRRRLAWRFEEDGSLTGTFRLPPLQGAVLLKALRAAAGDLEHPHKHEEEGAGVSAETPAGGGPPGATSSSLADALVAVAEAFLAGKVAGADDPEVYQVVVHVGADALTPAPRPLSPAGPAASPRKRRRSPGRAWGSGGPGPVPRGGRPRDQRVHRPDARLHRRAVLDGARPRRRGTAPGPPPPSAERGAAPRGPRTGHCRCRFPGCESRRVDLHHIQFWSHGGRTGLDNLISLCKYHHMLVHDRGYLIATARDGAFASTGPMAPPSRPAPPCPPPTAPSRTATMPASPRRRSSRPGTARSSTWTTPSPSASPTPGPPRTTERRDQAGDPERFQPSKWVMEPADWIRGIQERRPRRCHRARPSDPAGVPDRRQRPRSAKVMSTG